ncbi:MAG: lysophospholipid acyltransferase family protein [Acidobacteriota bacterium]
MDHAQAVHLPPGRVRLSYTGPNDRLGKRLVIRTIERLSGGAEIQRLYDGLQDYSENDLWGAALEALEIGLQLDGVSLDEVPRQGPVVLLANHPYGVVDGLALSYIASQIRQEFCVLTNSALCVDQRTERRLLPISFDEGRAAMRANIETKRRALAALARDECVAIFPSGAVATAEKVFGPAIDLEWRTFVAKLVRSSEATVVPLFFHGQNGPLFQLASRLSQTLRLSLLLHEVNNKRGRALRVTVGEPVAYGDLRQIRGREELTEHLRRTVMALESPAS